jgi:acylphosphatase
MPGQAELIGRRYVVRGRVQGVGFRDFVQRRASELGVVGTVRNLDDGAVEVVATGTSRQLSGLAGYLHQGPLWANVRGVEEHEHPLVRSERFQIIS